MRFFRYISVIFIILLLCSCQGDSDQQDCETLVSADNKQFIYESLSEMLEREGGMLKVVLSLADITDDGVPEVFLGVQSGMKTYRVSYKIYSLTDEKWIQPVEFMSDGYNVTDDSNLFHFEDDYRYDLFRNVYYKDEDGSTYFLGVSSSAYLGGSNEWIDEYFKSILKFDGEVWIVNSYSKPMEEFDISDNFFYLPSSTKIIDPNNIQQSIDECIENYLIKYDY